MTLTNFENFFKLKSANFFTCLLYMNLTDIYSNSEKDQMIVCWTICVGRVVPSSQTRSSPTCPGKERFVRPLQRKQVKSPERPRKKKKTVSHTQNNVENNFIKGTVSYWDGTIV